MNHSDLPPQPLFGHSGWADRRLRQPAHLPVPTFWQKKGWTIALTAALLAGCTTGASTPQVQAPQSYEAQLATHLKNTGAVMYGAYWCPHCAEQKEWFQEAIDLVPYVECDPNGEKSQAQLCRDKNIQGYPTWEINGQFYPGTQTLAELAELSNFQPKN